MIRRVFEPQVSLWQPNCEASLRQCGQFAAYGDNCSFLRFYEDDFGNRLSILENAATLTSHGEDTEEMRLFLTMDPSVTYVRTDAVTAASLAAMWNVSYQTEAVMRAPNGAMAHEYVNECPLKELYPVLVDGFGQHTLPPFDAWYADVHHRFRRDRCRAVAVFEEDIPVACAMTVAECDSAALIGAVATRPEARGKGYASACVLTLAHQLQQQSKIVYLSPKNEYAHRLYDRIGFTVVGEWGSVSRE